MLRNQIPDFLPFFINFYSFTLRHFFHVTTLHCCLYAHLYDHWSMCTEFLAYIVVVVDPILIPLNILQQTRLKQKQSMIKRFIRPFCKIISWKTFKRYSICHLYLLSNKNGFLCAWRSVGFVKDDTLFVSTVD